MDMTQNDTKTNKNSSNIPLTEKVKQDAAVEIKFLATSWLDDFEKKLFNGKTVNQIVNPQRYE